MPSASEQPPFLEHQFVGKTSLVLLNASRLGREEETLVITGPPRSGTSIISYIYRRAGFFLGDKLLPESHEDAEFHKAILTKEIDELDKLIKRRSGRARWGFKSPSALEVLPMLEEKLRNPVFIVCYRSSIAIARSVVRRNPNCAEDTQTLMSALDRAIRLQRVVCKQLNALRSPVALVDVHMAKQRPAKFVTEILELMSIEPTVALRDEIAEKISRPGYKKITQSSNSDAP